MMFNLNKFNIFNNNEIAKNRPEIKALSAEELENQMVVEEKIKEVASQIDVKTKKLKEVIESHGGIEQMKTHFSQEISEYFTGVNQGTWEQSLHENKAEYHHERKKPWAVSFALGLILAVVNNESRTNMSEELVLGLTAVAGILATKDTIQANMEERMAKIVDALMQLTGVENKMHK